MQVLHAQEEFSNVGGAIIAICLMCADTNNYQTCRLYTRHFDQMQGPHLLRAHLAEPYTSAFVIDMVA